MHVPWSYCQAAVIIDKRKRNQLEQFKKGESAGAKENRYSRLPRLSDTRYSAKGTKGKWRYASSKGRSPAISIYGYVGGRQI